MNTKPYTRFAAAFAMAATFTMANVQAAGEHVGPATEFAKTTVAKWISSPDLITAIKAQNVRHAVLTESQIDSLDKQWRAEVGASNRPLIDEVLARPVSKMLADIKNERRGQVLEIFVMDNRGLNVAQSDVTSDYWQGDEAKWKKTYSVGPDAVFVDEVEMDESSQTFQAQISMSIKDPETHAVIGAITVGVNVDAL